MTRCRSGFKTGCNLGVMSRARKKGRSGRKAHPTVVFAVEKKKHKRVARTDWHIAYIIRCAKRGESVAECDLVK